MLAALRHAVGQARRLGAEYADARWLSDEREQVAARDGRVERLLAARSEGFGVRTLVDGAWGFAARPGSDPEALEQALTAALATARVAARLRPAGVAPVRLQDEPPQQGRYATPVLEDPFRVAAADKVALVCGVTDALRRGVGPLFQGATAQVHARRQHKLLATSDGTAVDQEIVHTGCGSKLVVGRGGEVQHRSYPMDLDGGVAAGGFEVVRAFDLTGQVERMCAEAAALLDAPPCPSGRTAVVLDTPQLALQIHESCGHPTELDRAFGEEISLAGGSFLTPDRLGRFRYGSDRVHLTADAQTPGGLGTFGWDDEGVPARRTPLVAAGQFVGYLSSRETAARLGLAASGGCVRAESWNRFPIIRMVNVSLEPAPGGPSLEELIADTDDGVLLGNNRSWSIDDLRLNFQFGCEIAWEIKRGRRTRLLRNPVYSGVTPEFWSRCDAIGGPQAFRMWGFESCGKGDPMQLMAVGHGCAPARFRDVDVGSGT